jgi:spore coat protein A
MNRFFTRLIIFLVAVTLIGAGLALQSKAKTTDQKFRIQQIPGGTLDPLSVPKFVEQLVVPPAMPGKSNKNKDMYDIAVRQFQQQILPSGFPMTTVWSYGPKEDVIGDNYGRTPFDNPPGSYNYPSFTIEATWNKTVQVIWRNELRDARSNFRPHLLPVDPTLHWANPPGGLTGRDTRPMPGDPWFSTENYTGPVPIITHVHGAHTNEDSDGYPEAWFLPDAVNIPAGYAKTGTFFDYFNAKYGNGWMPGAAAFKYPNSQRATTLWYHDHTLGMTRLNVYAGPAGFWLIRGGLDDLNLGYIAPGVGDSPFGFYTEIPIAIQDRSFNTDGSLFYPDTREFFDEFPGPYIPVTPVSPIWNPEFFGNMMVVNGRTWPYLEVNQQRYRFRLLNGCNSRFLILDFNDIPGVKVWWIGTEGGFLPAPVDVTNDHNNRILLALAERADIIVDFANVDPGSYILHNLGPDEPFGGGEPGNDFDPSDPASTGQVMEFRVQDNKPASDPGADPATLTLPAVTPLANPTNTQYISLNEVAFEHPNFPAGDGPVAALLGTYDPGTDTPTPLMWRDAITENPVVGAVEEWKMYNLTEDAHPIHIHLIQFQVVSRAAIDGGPSVVNGPNGVEDWETGFKDTVIAYPGEVTTVKARFDIPGLFVWHCHIVEHEDNEMMRPYAVGPYVMPAGVELRRIR